MAELLFFANPAELFELEPGDSPRNSFVCMLGLGVHVDARAQLYSIITGQFLDDALAMEEPVLALASDSSWITVLADTLVERISELEEQEITDILSHWMLCEEIESLELDQDELLDYLFALASLCLNAREEEARVYTFTTI